MKQFCSLFILCSLAASIAVAQSNKALPRIAIAGLGIESSTFSPALTDEAAFHAKYGADIFTIYPFFSADSSLRKGVVWIPTIDGHALPGGAVTREAYESLVNKTLDSLKKQGLMTAFFMISMVP